MTAKTDYRSGLTIPDHIKKELSPALIRKLEDDGHGISFNTAKSAQMRYKFLKQDFGGNYPRSAYDSWEKLLLSAMATYSRLAREMPNGGRYLCPDKGVRFCERARDDRSYPEFSYQLHYKKDGKDCFKSFYCGNENTMDSERKKHAELTAWHFRRLYCENGDPSVLDAENMVNWQHTKYYENK